MLTDGAVAREVVVSDGRVVRGRRPERVAGIQLREGRRLPFYSRPRHLPEQLRAVIESYSQELGLGLLTPIGPSDKIAAVTLTPRPSGAVSDPVREGPGVGVRSLKTEQYSSA